MEAGVYKKKIQDLKSDSIDPDLTQRVEERLKHWRREHQEQQEVMSELCNCLPDKIPEEFMFGHTGEILEVKDLVQNQMLQK